MAENDMKKKEFGPKGACPQCHPPPDPPLQVHAYTHTHTDKHDDKITQTF